MRRARIRLLALSAVALLLVGIAGALPGLASDAATITKVGWWSRNPASQAPADGFNVQRAPDGAVSVAAIEVASSDDLRSATLILAEAGGVRQDAAVLQACITPNAWKPGAAQAWGEAPKSECEQASVDLARNATAATWSGDVLKLLGDIDKGPVSLMIVPKASSVPVGFDIQFKKPQLQAEAEPRTGGTGGFSFDSGGSGSSGSSGSGSFGSGGSTSSGSSSFGSTSFDPGPSTFAPAGSVDPIVDAPSADDDGSVSADASVGESAAIPFPVAGGAATDPSGSGNRVLQTFFFLVVSTVAAVGSAVGRRWLRERQPDAIA